MRAGSTSGWAARNRACASTSRAYWSTTGTGEPAGIDAARLADAALVAREGDGPEVVQVRGEDRVEPARGLTAAVGERPPAAGRFRRDRQRATEVGAAAADPDLLLAQGDTGRLLAAKGRTCNREGRRPDGWIPRAETGADHVATATGLVQGSDLVPLVVDALARAEALDDPERPVPIR